uniref:Uncharacterized protein n=1 Tax=viral metagenome TaxID=1070528 RepID=A0A6C0DGF7_9ZZZZ
MLMISPLFTVEEVCSDSGVASMNRAGSARKFCTICFTWGLSGYFFSNALHSFPKRIRSVAIKSAAFCLSGISRTLYVFPSTLETTFVIGKFPPPTID